MTKIRLLLVGLIVGSMTLACASSRGKGRDLGVGEKSAAPLSNTIRWSTASEVENLGFDIYRSRDEAGPFQRLTGRPIPGAGTSDTPRSYEFVDDTIEPQTEYFYYIESISFAGIRERFSPVGRAGPKPASVQREDGSPGTPEER